MNQLTDTFHFSYQSDAEHGVVTKQTILAEVSKLFDSLGLLGPIIAVAKLILQDLWKSGAHWNKLVPQTIHIR